MKNFRKPNSTRISTTSGATLIEVVLILVVIGLLAATAAVRVNTGTTGLTTATDGVASHLRLVQTLAIDSSRDLWGVQFDSSAQKYRVFQCEDKNNCDADADENAVSIPGTGTDAAGWIALSGSGIRFKIKNKNKDSVAFDAYGSPLEIKSKGASLLKNQSFTLTLEDESGNSREIQVTPGTGFIQ